MENEKQVGDLQELINNKAENRLKADLKAFEARMSTESLISGYHSDQPRLSFEAKKGEFKTDTIGRLLNPNWGVYYKALYEFWLPVYIQEETTNFVSQVDKLKEDAAHLFNTKADRDY